MMKLFEPIEIKGIKLKNRIVMAPMLVGVGFGKKARDYWGERAKGGVGLINLTAVMPDILIFDDIWGRKGGVQDFVGRLASFVKDLHEKGTKVGIQINHLNRLPMGTGSPIIGEPVGPSAGSKEPSAFDPATEVREMTVGEIQFVIEKFAKAAARLKEAGMDFVELHGAHNYLTCQFFSPLTNHRTDKYGGSLAGRMRFGLECIEAIRKEIGKDYPLFYRLGSIQNTPGGLKIEDSVEFAVELEKAGVDLIDVSSGDPELGAIPGAYAPMGCFVPQAAKIKQRVHVPVIAVGRIHTSEVAEAVLNEGKADLVAIGRQLIADPYWAEKVAQNRIKDIAPCIGCNNCLDSTIFAHGELRCTVNPAATREADYVIKPAEKFKRVMVIGGGPAGLETARVAAQRGHKVTLCEKEDKLGGQLLVADRAPHKERIEALRNYLENQAEKSGVTIKKGVAVSPEYIVETNPEVVVIATGATPLIPRIPGVERASTATEVLSGKKKAGERVVIIGGGMVGCETAEFLVEKGKQVVILEMLASIGADMGEATRVATLEILKKAGVKMETNTKALGIEPNGVKASQGGKEVFYAADTVLLATGMVAQNQLAGKLPEKFTVYQIGDCTKPSRIVNAIGDGARIGREI